MMPNNTEPIQATGGCLCGAVRYEVRGPLRSVVNCHCTQCRRTSGHFVAATAAYSHDLILTKSEGLHWYHSSAFARRGFCQTCGSNLFWEKTAEPDIPNQISIMAGTLDSTVGLKTAAHIFVADAGNYYVIEDDLPKLERGGVGSR